MGPVRRGGVSLRGRSESCFPSLLPVSAPAPPGGQDCVDPGWDFLAVPIGLLRLLADGGATVGLGGGAAQAEMGLADLGWHPGSAGTRLQLLSSHLSYPPRTHSACAQPPTHLPGHTSHTSASGALQGLPHSSHLPRARSLRSSLDFPPQILQARESCSRGLVVPWWTSWPRAPSSLHRAEEVFGGPAAPGLRWIPHLLLL